MATLITQDTPIIAGTKTCSSGNAEPIVSTSTPIHQGVEVWVRNLATNGTYVEVGSSTVQPRRLTTVGANVYIDFTTDLAKVYVKCDVSSNAVVEYLGA